MRLFPSTVVSNSELPMMFGPNITGNSLRFGISYYITEPDTGALFMEQDNSATHTSRDASTDHALHNAKLRPSFDASLSSGIYKSGSTVQPASLLGLACIKF